ncbi:MAG: hypothetical protein BGO98_32515 [Myxococcales bacterium 68-20]|nr:PaaI family thioesterase [Myxococcales bacterium]OJY18459.1 MAG: hypothetical protein BGO98_32515 [Myxococcales bacterium 68-20]
MRSATPVNPRYVEDVTAVVGTTPAMRFYGFELVRVGPGIVELALDFREPLTAVPGTFQGTIQGAIADFAGTLAALTLCEQGSKVATIDYTLKFMEPAKGARLFGRGRVLRPGKSLTFCAADVFVERDGQERHCAACLLTTRNFAP